MLNFKRKPSHKTNDNAEIKFIGTTVLLLLKFYLFLFFLLGFIHLKFNNGKFQLFKYSKRVSYIFGAQYFFLCFLFVSFTLYDKNVVWLFNIKFVIVLNQCILYMKNRESIVNVLNHFVQFLPKLHKEIKTDIRLSWMRYMNAFISVLLFFQPYRIMMIILRSIGKYSNDVFFNLNYLVILVTTCVVLKQAVINLIFIVLTILDQYYTELNVQLAISNEGLRRLLKNLHIEDAHRQQARIIALCSAVIELNALITEFFVCIKFIIVLHFFEQFTLLAYIAKYLLSNNFISSAYFTTFTSLLTFFQLCNHFETIRAKSFATTVDIKYYLKFAEIFNIYPHLFTHHNTSNHQRNLKDTAYGKFDEYLVPFLLQPSFMILGFELNKNMFCKLFLLIITYVYILK